MFVYDEYEGKVVEVDMENQIERQRFDNKYNFHCDSLFDYPEHNGVREFMNGSAFVFTSEDPIALATAVEERIATCQ